MRNLKEKFDRVREICGGWGLYEPGNSTEQAQLLKALSEVGELADSILKDDRDQAKDDIGDILVCLINAHELSRWKTEELCFEDYEDDEVDDIDLLPVNHAIATCCYNIALGIDRKSWGRLSVRYCLMGIAKHFNLTIEECLDQAISVIEKRKGRIINGAFMKDAQ